MFVTMQLHHWSTLLQVLLVLIGTSDAFVGPHRRDTAASSYSSQIKASSPFVPKSRPEDDFDNGVSPSSDFWQSLQEDLKMRWEIAKVSSQEGWNFKQVMADVLAGEYEAEPVRNQIEKDIRSAPVVMYTWEASPSCKSAIEAFELALSGGNDPSSQGIMQDVGGATAVRVIRLDDPWSEGNPVRAQLGKKVGRSSVPCIFIGGKYVGGFDAGTGPEAPGIQAMAFQGTLRPALEAAGLTLAPAGNKEESSSADENAAKEGTQEESLLSVPR